MNCPRCGLGMQSGMAVVKMKPEWLPTLAGVGLNAYQHLWFVPLYDVKDHAAVRSAMIDDAGEMILKVGQAATAHRCKSCSLVVLIGGDPG